MPLALLHSMVNIVLGGNPTCPPRSSSPLPASVTKRYRCIRCRSRIDIDLYSCPACGEERPLRYLRSRRMAGYAILMAATVFVVSAWIVLA